MSTDRTFAFVDLAGFTALTDAHGDAEAIRIARGFQQRAQDALAPGDELVKTIGDEVMLAFADPNAAIVALEQMFRGPEDGLVLLPRAGAHHGSAIVDGADYFGHAVNVAARVAAQAAGGQLLVTDQVAEAAQARGHVITHMGAVTLRNIVEPLDIYEVDLLDEQPDTAVDPVCAMRVPTRGERAIGLMWRNAHVWFCGLPCVARFAADPDRFTV
jgi:class 3 adenylate cyclase